METRPAGGTLILRIRLGAVRKKDARYTEVSARSFFLSATTHKRKSDRQTPENCRVGGRLGNCVEPVAHARSGIGNQFVVFARNNFNAVVHKRYSVYAFFGHIVNFEIVFAPITREIDDEIALVVVNGKEFVILNRRISLIEKDVIQYNSPMGIGIFYVSKMP